MPSVLITGANRGLGLEFARQYGAAGWRVYAACREPAAAAALAALPGEISRHRLDVTDAGEIAGLAADLAGAPLDVLINNAGINYDNGEFGDSDDDTWLHTLRVNTIAPLHVAEGLIDNLLSGRRKMIVNLSSKMASIAENASGGDYSYRTSKAALNMLARGMANDLRGRGVIVVVISPGWVQTDMGGPSASLPAAESIAGMRAMVERLTLADSGSFLDWQGRVLPW
jgi:NAD(P)-dependent dehydrogenase (short-subunit alcohol dehydrogenase family)